MGVCRGEGVRIGRHEAEVCLWFCECKCREKEVGVEGGDEVEGGIQGFSKLNFDKAIKELQSNIKEGFQALKFTKTERGETGL